MYICMHENDIYLCTPEYYYLQSSDFHCLSTVKEYAQHAYNLYYITNNLQTTD